jgi:hypothetical protein
MKTKKNLVWAGVFVAALILLFPATLAEEDEPATAAYHPSPPQLDGIEILDDGNTIVVTDQDILDSMEVLSTLPLDPPGDSGYCGATESIDGEAFAQAVAWVHTYKDREEPGDPMHVKFIYHDIFLKDLRPTHGAYIIVPTSDFRKVEIGSEWRLGPILAYCYVPANEIITRTHIGTYGVGLFCRNDTLFEFRINLRIYVETDPGHFELDNQALDNGLWFYDVEPWGWDNEPVLKKEVMVAIEAIECEVVGMEGELGGNILG